MSLLGPAEIRALADRLGLRPTKTLGQNFVHDANTVRRIVSGAGHDAQNLAAVTEAGMLFIPSQGGKSHRPDEMSDWRAIERGGNALLHTLLTLSG